MHVCGCVGWMLTPPNPTHATTAAGSRSGQRSNTPMAAAESGGAAGGVATTMGSGGRLKFEHDGQSVRPRDRMPYIPSAFIHSRPCSTHIYMHGRTDRADHLRVGAGAGGREPVHPTATRVRTYVGRSDSRSMHVSMYILSRSDCVHPYISPAPSSPHAPPIGSNRK